MKLRSENLRLPAPAAIALIGTALIGTALIGATSAFAEGTTERERTMSRYSQCKWTDAMSKQVYECVKRNNGFNTHWCFDETVETNCEPDPLPAAAGESSAAPVVVAQAGEAEMDEVQMIDAEDLSEWDVTQEEAKKRAARQGEENLRGTIEREQTMLRYRNCKWTDEMGRYTYECVKRNDGFGTHWCYDEALELLCPKDQVEPKS
jgi:hypothetical protein